MLGLGEQEILFCLMAQHLSILIFFFPYFCRLVKELEDHHIVQIACGDQHAMALSRGSLFQAHFSSKQESHYGKLALSVSGDTVRE